ncbi:uncharacterized protein I303_103248 [Kwoniella dejecticola CBS 10117]|uniref:Uncharacterized protein n=1 Tax=Kwoniella dejecticola CBS 10117 TaxID=1296121 RepID=A0A1A6AAZ7_9TREE|nr:uncharacterized protein I303_03271 [Kwoniella dejecticola CBS 10117]OBR87246.1 hypothetical protein I303_03271 [Kwoniella dejecticola CBS 10117]
MSSDIAQGALRMALEGLLDQVTSDAINTPFDRFGNTIASREPAPRARWKEILERYTDPRDNARCEQMTSNCAYSSAINVAVSITEPKPTNTRPGVYDRQGVVRYYCTATSGVGVPSSEALNEQVGYVVPDDFVRALAHPTQGENGVTSQGTISLVEGEWN